MDTLDRYVFSAFLRNFLGSTILLTGVAFMAKLMERLDLFLNNKGADDAPFAYMLWNLPNFAAIVTAPALMFSVSFTLASFSRSNEIPVMLAAGRSFLRVSRPILVFALILTPVMFLFNEFLAFPGVYHSNRYYHAMKGRAPDFERLTRKELVFRSHERYYTISEFRPREKTFKGLHMAVLGPGNELQTILSGTTGTISGTDWNIDSGSEIIFDAYGQVIRQEVFRNRIVKLPEGERAILETRDEKEFVEKSIFDLFNDIERRSGRGMDIREHIVEVWWHFTFPLIYIFVTLTGVILSGILRKSSIAASVGMAILSSVFYYIIMYFGKSLAVVGALPAFLGGSLANWVFLAVTGYLSWKNRS